MKTKTISDCMPVLGFEDNILISPGMDMTLGIRIHLPELYSCSREQLLGIHDAFKRIVMMLPAGVLLHRQDVFLDSVYQCTTDQSQSFLTGCYLNHFNGRSYLKQESYLFISAMNNGLLKNWLGNSLLTPSKQKKKITGQRDQLKEIQCNISGQLRQSGIECEEIGMEEMRLLINQYMTLGFETENNILSNPDFRDHLKVGGQFVEFCSLSDYAHLPSEVSPVSRHPGNHLPVSMLYPVSHGLNFSHIVNTFLYMGNQTNIKSRLENSQKKIFSLSRFSTENKLNAVLLSDFLEDVQQTGEPIIRTHCNLMYFDHSLRGLKQKRSEAGTAFSSVNCLPYRHSFDLPLMFWASMPGSTQLPESETLLLQAPQACCLMNFEGSITNSRSSFFIHFSDRKNACPVKVDVSDEPMEKHWVHNRNKIIIGGSGSGKSFLTNHLLRHYGESNNCHTVLLDVGRSYEMLVHYLDEQLKMQGGAMHIEFTEEHPISFNPFVLTDGLSTERKQTILSVLYTIYKPQLSEIDKDVIAQSVLAYYKQCTGNYSFDTYYDFAKGWIPELVKEKGLCFNSGEYFFILSKYYRDGEYGYLLNRQMITDEFFNCPFIVFELDNIKDHPVIFPVATLIIIDIFLQKMRLLKGVRKVICIEEAWKAIATPQMAGYIKYFFKTIRKFFGEAIVVTQEIEDIISSPLIRDAIVNNADTKILLDMSKFANKFDTISQVLGLSSFQKEQILSVNRDLPTNRKLKECFIAWGSHSRVYALETSRQEYWCYTSEEKEKQSMIRKMNDHASFIELLNAL
ncbi:TraG family conjugative transposon ATPase [Carboxylicivirga linearis]|uniref:TraG family conjugative transposon ATPase n=1 Tax=Carboxylicivirga linearis TaxID=1628157 RepID=A0ABS5K1Y0_9BACT|nr:TraG family conjugative transposon ATPase [Carboxylicivirga linearis]MBS2101177.1 TraG family conjugative transposon ATPase [Carboxylicivirga linearis]